MSTNTPNTPNTPPDADIDRLRTAYASNPTDENWQAIADAYRPAPIQSAELAELRKLAEAATPGEWTAMPHGRVIGGPKRHYTNGSAQAQIAAFSVTFHDQAPDDEPERQQANADFCAVANPAAVLRLLDQADSYAVKCREWCRERAELLATIQRLTATPAQPIAPPVEPEAPAILEALSYHAAERDDLTLEDAVKAFRFGYKEVRERDDRAMLAQLIHLMASAPAAQPIADVRAPTDEPSEAESLIACLEDDAAKLKDANPDDEMAQTMLDAAAFIAARAAAPVSGLTPFMWVNPTDLKRTELTDYADRIEIDASSVKFGHCTMPLYLADASARDSALEEAANACRIIGKDWKDAGDYAKSHAAEYLANWIIGVKTISAAPVSGQGASGLPDLPLPLEEVRAWFRGEYDYARAGNDYYTREQMRTYGQLCIDSRPRSEDSRADALPTNNEVYAAVCAARDNSNFYVSTNAVNDVMAAVRALSKSAAPESGGQAAQEQAVSVAAGWKLVPIAPDQRMIAAFIAEYHRPGGTESGCYRVMLDAAPPAPQAATALELTDADKQHAERYRWLRDKKINVAHVLDKRTDWVPEDERVPGVGGYWMYEYRAGDELDAAIDAARLAGNAGDGVKA